jgi:hypothetical protein
MSRADPKPGRWLLPLVVAGIVGFTYVFVNALPPAPAQSTTTTLAALTTTTAVTATTTSTTIDPAIAAFMIAADTVAGAAADLAQEALDINNAWDAGGSYSDALDGLEDLETRTAEYATAVANTTVPANVTESWTSVVAATDELAVAGTDMVAGLQSSDQGQARQAALDDYQAAAAAVQAAAAAAKVAALA